MAKRIEIEWQPQPRQLIFLRACGLSFPFEGDAGKPSEPVAAVIGYGGAAGGGKSDALLAAGIIGGLAYRGINIGYFRREYPRLEGPGGAIMRSQELMSSWARWNGTMHRWTLPTQSILQFCHCAKETDVYSYQSQQFDILLFDEFTEFTRFQIRYLLTRNRATRDGVFTFAAWGSNPGQVGHAHARDEYIAVGEWEQPHDVEVEPGEFERHIFIPSKLSDNRILEQRDPGYRRKLQAQPEEIRKALLDGDWNVFAGQYFSEFRREKHIVPPFEIPGWWERFISIDWGYNDPCAVYWHACGPDGRVYTYRELYISQTIASDVAKKIRELSAGEEISYGVMSPDAWAQRGNVSRGESIAETFMKAGVPVRPADNNRLNGWLRMHEYLADAPDGVPYWQIFSTCANLIRTLPALVHDDNRIEDVSGKCEDHAAESCRYALMSRPPRSYPPVKPDYSDDDDDDDRPAQGYFD